MQLSDLFQETYYALSTSKVRSGLTVLGIVIGIASIIATISIGQGTQNSVNSRIQSLGSNLLIVFPGFSQGVGQIVRSGRGNATTLTQDDADAITRGVSNIASLAPELSHRAQVTAQGTNTNTSVLGTVPAYTTIRNVTMEGGSFITDSNVGSLEKVAVLGPTTRDDLFGTGADAVGKTISISGIDFQVIGVTQSKGGSGFGNQDDIIFIPITTARQFLGGTNPLGMPYVTAIDIQVTTQDEMQTAQSDVTNLLLERHNISNPQNADFSVLNQADIVSAASSITGIFTIFLASIASISLLVGGIGIMNMMLTSVTERTREIGLRKAIGATKRDITLQFLSESVMLTVIGGALGICLGWIVAMLVSRFGSIPTSVSLFSLVLAVGVSAAIGIIFGYYPALRAASLNPIEALRYE